MIVVESIAQDFLFFDGTKQGTFGLVEVFTIAKLAVAKIGVKINKPLYHTVCFEMAKRELANTGRVDQYTAALKVVEA